MHNASSGVALRGHTPSSLQHSPSGGSRRAIVLRPSQAQRPCILVSWLLPVRRSASGAVVCRSVHGAPQAAPRSPPTVPGSLPLVDDLPKIDLRHKFESHHKLLNETGERVLLVRYPGSRSLVVREPADVQEVIRGPEGVPADAASASSATNAFTRHWQTARGDASAATSSLLAQADGALAVAAAGLAAVLVKEATEAGAAGAHSPGQVAAQQPGMVRVEVQGLMRRHALGLLGLSSLAGEQAVVVQGQGQGQGADGPVGGAVAAARAAAEVARAAAVATTAAVEELVVGYVGPEDVKALDEGFRLSSVAKGAAAAARAAAGVAKTAAVASAAAVEELVGGYVGPEDVAALSAELEPRTAAQRAAAAAKAASKAARKAAQAVGDLVISFAAVDTTIERAVTSRPMAAATATVRVAASAARAAAVTSAAAVEELMGNHVGAEDIQAINAELDPRAIARNTAAAVQAAAQAARAATVTAAAAVEELVTGYVSAEDIELLDFQLPKQQQQGGAKEGSVAVKEARKAADAAHTAAMAAAAALEELVLGYANADDLALLNVSVDVDRKADTARAAEEAAAAAAAAAGESSPALQAAAAALAAAANVRAAAKASSQALEELVTKYAGPADIEVLNLQLESVATGQSGVVAAKADAGAAAKGAVKAARAAADAARAAAVAGAAAVEELVGGNVSPDDISNMEASLVAGAGLGGAKAATEAARSAAVAGAAAVEGLVGGAVSPGEISSLQAGMTADGLGRGARAAATAAAGAARTAAVAGAAAVEELVGGYVGPEDIQALDAQLSRKPAATASAESIAAAARAAAAAAETAAVASAAAVEELVTGYVGADDVVALINQLEGASQWLVLQLPLLPEAVVSGPGQQRYAESVAALEAMVAGVVQQRREAGAAESDKPRDLLACLLRAQRGGAGHHMSDQEIRDELVSQLLCGTEAALALVAHHLADDPKAQQRARDEVLRVLGGRLPEQLTAADCAALPFLAACVRETLRLHPVLPEVSRPGSKDEVVGGYSVPAGATLVASLFSLHRHPAIWPQPDTWLPQRWLGGPEAAGLEAKQENAFAPFGAAPPGCARVELAMLGMKMTLAALLASGLELLPDLSAHDLDLGQGAATLRARNGVWLRVRKG